MPVRVDSRVFVVQFLKIAKIRVAGAQTSCYIFSMVTYDLVREIALALPNVEEGTSYGTPALKVRGKLFVRLKEDGETIVLKTTYEEREELMAHDSETYFITDHYLNYPYILVSLNRVHPDALKELILISYRLAKPSQNRKQ